MLAKRIAYKQFSGFVVVGCLNTLVGYLCFAGLITLGMGHWPALFLASCLAIVFNYFSYSRWVFDQRDQKHFLRHVLVFCFIYVLNGGLLQGAANEGVRLIWAQSVIAPAMAVLSFGLMKYYVFSDNTFFCDKKALGVNTVQDASSIDSEG